MTKRKKPRSLAEWLGLRTGPIYEWGISLGPLLGALLIFVAIALSIAAIFILIHFMLALSGSEPYGFDTSGEAIRNIGLVLAALFGAPLLVWRSMVLAKQANIAEQVLLNQKFNDAASGLLARREITRVIGSGKTEKVISEWEDDIFGRASSIDKLMGLTLEDPHSAARTVRMLASYVRGNFPVSDTNPTLSTKTIPIPRLDLQQAIDCIGRLLPMAYDADSRDWRLDLKGCDFSGVSFSGGYFYAADFTRSRMEFCKFEKCNLAGAILEGCVFNYSDFWDSNVRGANFDQSVFNKPSGTDGIFLARDFTGVSLDGADISAIHEIGGRDDYERVFVTKQTLLDPEIEKYAFGIPNQKKASLKIRLGQRARKPDEQTQLAIDLINRRGVTFWSPYSPGDGAKYSLYKRFLEHHGLEKWPFRR